jgi:hypothetical protein
VELSSTAGLQKTKQFINTIENTIRSMNVGPELRIDMNPSQKLNVGIGAGLNYYRTKYSLQSTLNTSYISEELNSSLDWEMPKGFFFSTEFTYTFNKQRATGFNTNVPLWNASISKQMLRFNRGELRLSARDLLNQNIGISRNTNNNYIEDSRYLTLRRFFLLSFTYSLSKTGLNNGGQGGGMKMIMR